MTKRKLTSIPLEEKYYAIQRIEKKECTQEKIASKFGVNKATVSRWMSKEQMASIKEAYENNTVGTRKRLRSSVYEDLEITIHEWFKQSTYFFIEFSFKVIIMIIQISII